LRLMQVRGTVEWNQNVCVGEGSAGGSEDVGEREAALVAVPRPDRERRVGRAKRALGEPQDEHRVEQADERRDAENGRLLARLRVGEAEQPQAAESIGRHGLLIECGGVVTATSISEPCSLRWALPGFGWAAKPPSRHRSVGIRAGSAR